MVRPQEANEINVLRSYYQARKQLVLIASMLQLGFHVGGCGSVWSLGKRVN
jgi:hypothetical protein